MDELQAKKQKLEEYLKELGSIAVAFSSGVDSTFLLKVAKDVLNDVTAEENLKNVMTAFYRYYEAADILFHKS